MVRVVEGVGESLDVAVEHAPKVVHHPLTYAGRQVFFEIGAERTEDRDHDYRQDSKIED